MQTLKAVSFFKALADPTRLKLMIQLRDAGASLCVCDLTQQLEQPQPTVSRHLSHLRKMGLVTCERRGTWVWYAINPNLPVWCLQIIHATQLTADDTLPLPTLPKHCC